MSEEEQVEALTPLLCNTLRLQHAMICAQQAQLGSSARDNAAGCSADRPAEEAFGGSASRSLCSNIEAAAPLPRQLVAL